MGTLLIQGGTREGIPPKEGSSVGEKGWESGYLVSDPNSVVTGHVASICLPASCLLQERPGLCFKDLTLAPSSLQPLGSL